MPQDNRITPNPFAPESEKGVNGTGAAVKIREGLERMLRGLGVDLPAEHSDDDLAFVVDKVAAYLETSPEEREPNQLSGLEAFSASAPEDSTTASIRKQFGISKIEWLRRFAPRPR